MLKVFGDHVSALLAQLGIHPGFLAYAAPISVLVMLATLVATPWIVARIPEDYFVRRRHVGLDTPHLAVRVLKNLLGVVLLLAGLAMLALPGPGIIALLGALALLEIPGKHQLEGWLVSRPGVRTLIARLRQRAGRPPLRMPPRRR